MSLSRESTEWHLTESGWVEGSTKVDFGPDTIKPKPADAVLSFKYFETQSSSFSKMETGTRELWRSDDEKKIAELLAKYGPCPQSL